MKNDELKAIREVCGDGSLRNLLLSGDYSAEGDTHSESAMVAAQWMRKHVVSKKYHVASRLVHRLC